MRHAPVSLFAVAALLTGLPVSAQEAAPVPATPAGEPVVLPPLVVSPRAAEAAPAPTVEAIPRVWEPAPRDEEGRTAYGLYLTARSALAGGEAAAGAAYLGAVEALTPEQPLVREQAFLATLLAGDLDVAARIAPPAEGASPFVVEAQALVSAVQTYVAGDARAANAALTTRPIAAPHARAGALISPWIAAAAGDWDRALVEPNPTADPIALLFGRYHRAQLLEHRRRYPEAEAALQQLGEDPRAASIYRAAYGEYLERRGRHAEAVAFYDAAIAGGAPEPGLASARERAARRGRPPALIDYRSGAARALTAAAAQATAEGAHEFAVVYLRLSLNLDNEPEGQLLLGQTLAQAGLKASARTVLSQVPAESPPLYAAAQVQLGLSLAADDRAEEALDAYRRAAQATPQDARIAYLTASQLVQLERYDEALAILNGPLLNTADQGPEVRFMRGAAYESLGRIAEAEAELWTALQASPDEPVFLNYLGYLWVDSGTRVTEGRAMIERAHAADPEDGNIQDSLGWAQFRQGEYEAAVETLEQAVAKEPANAEINDHLGDAYWSVGRRREATFQWNRVLTLDPDAERRASVTRKLAEGLDL